MEPQRLPHRKWPEWNLPGTSIDGPHLPVLAARLWYVRAVVVVWYCLNAGVPFASGPLPGVEPAVIDAVGNAPGGGIAADARDFGVKVLINLVRMLLEAESLGFG